MGITRNLLAIAVVFSGSLAHANVELDVLGGGHVFSKTNPYGVDEMSTESEKEAPLVGVRLGFYLADRIGIEGEGALIQTKTVDEPATVQDLTYRGHLVLLFRAGSADHRFIPFLLVGGGIVQVYKTEAATVVKDSDPVAYGGLGFKIRSRGGWNVRVDFRGQFEKSRDTTKKFTNDFEGLLSLGKEFGGHKSSKPERAAPPPVEEDREPPRVVAKKDSDSDGVLDKADKCPNDAEDKDGFQDDDGCPDPDNDSDGVTDADDKCPNEPEDKDGFQDDDGCPDLDNDQDGIADEADKCPVESETRNGFDDDDGCPDEIPPALKKATGVVAGIEFKAETAALTPAAMKVLDKTVKVLAGFKQVKLEIGIHTDDQKPSKKSKFADNDELSQARADSVKAYLVKKGVDDGRLTAKGYGDGAPLIEVKGKKAGKLKAARAKNRRVELKLAVGDAPASDDEKKDEAKDEKKDEKKDMKKKDTKKDAKKKGDKTDKDEKKDE